MDNEHNNADDVMSITQEQSKMSSLKDISTNIFDSAAKFRTKDMLDRALKLQQNRTNMGTLKEIIIELNDTEDFKEAPRFKRNLRLKTKKSSSSNTIADDIVVIDEKNQPPALPDLHERNNISAKGGKNILAIGGKGRNITGEEFTHIKSEYSREITSMVSEIGSMKDISCNSQSELATSSSRSSYQTCLVCGMDVESVIYKTHRLDCLRQNFSKPDKSKDAETIEQVTCHICRKSITHMNSQRRTQHINKCIDMEDAAKQEEITYQQQLQTARTAVMSCPMCGKKFKVQSSRQSHLKRCAVTNKMTVDQVINLVKQQEEEHQTKLNAGILPEDFRPTKLKPLHRKLSKATRPKGQLDEDTQLAMALSTSLAENQEKEDIAHFGLADNAWIQDQAVPGKGYGRNKKGKLADSASLLMTLSREEAMERISHRITRYIFSANQISEDPETPPFKTGTNMASALSSSATVMLPTPPVLWSKTSLDMLALESSFSPPSIDKTGDLCFYVKELMPPVSVNTVFTGSKLRRVSSIPGRRRSGDLEHQPEIDKNANSSIASPSSSQTVEILAKLAMESDETKDESICCRLPDLEMESKEDDNDGDSSLQQSGFCKESPVKVESDNTDVLSSYARLVNHPSFSDLVIMADHSSEIHAHKIILHGRCPELLSISSITNGRDVIDLTEYGEESVLCMLNYVYGGQTLLYPSCLADVKQLADRFSLTGLKIAASSVDVENLSIDDKQTAEIIECDEEMGTDEERNRCEESNKDTFDDSDWLDVFQTQRENLRLKTEVIEDSAARSEDFEVMDKSDETAGNLERELETLQDNCDMEVTDCDENINLNNTNASSHPTNRTDKEITQVDKTFHINCNKDFGKNYISNNNGDVHVGNENKDSYTKEDGCHNSEERTHNFSQCLTNIQVRENTLDIALTNKNHCMQSLSADNNCTQYVFTKREDCIQSVPGDEEHCTQSVLADKDTETVPALPAGNILRTPPVPAVTPEIAERNSIVNTGLKPVELSTLEDSLLIDHSIDNSILINQCVEVSLVNHSVLADIMCDSSSNNNDTSVSSKAPKRKKKKVSVKEFKSLVRKVLTSLPDTAADSGQQLQADLTDEDIKRIQIKIEQGLKAVGDINDINDSVYIPNVLEDTGEDSKEVLITYADIKSPLKPKRRQDKKSGNLQTGGPCFPEHLKLDDLSVQTTQNVDAISSLICTEYRAVMENISQPLPSATTTVDYNPVTSQKYMPHVNSNPITPQKSVLHVNSNSVTPQKSVLPVNSNPVTPQKFALHVNSNSVTPQKSMPQVNSIAITPQKSVLHVNSNSVTPQKSVLPVNSRLVAQTSQFQTLALIQTEKCNSTTIRPSLLTPRRCSGRAYVGHIYTLQKCLKSQIQTSSGSLLDNSLNTSHTIEVSSDDCLTPESTSYKGLKRSQPRDNLPLNLSSSSKLNDGISNDIVKTSLVKNSSFLSSRLQTKLTSTATMSADAEYISGDELFTDDEEEFRPSNSKVVPVKWNTTGTLFDDKVEFVPSSSQKEHSMSVSRLLNEKKESRPSNSSVDSLKSVSPNMKKKSKPSNSSVNSPKSVSPNMKKKSKPSNSRIESPKSISPNRKKESRPSNPRLQSPESISPDKKKSRPLNSRLQSPESISPDNKISRPLNSRLESPKLLSPDKNKEFRPSMFQKLPQQWLSPSDPSWMLATRSISYSPVLKEIANKTIMQKEKLVRRNIFSQKNAVSTMNNLHSANPSDLTLDQTHQHIKKRGQNASVDSPGQELPVMSSLVTSTSTTKIDPRMETEIKKESDDTPGTTTVQPPNMNPTLTKANIIIKDVHSHNTATAEITLDKQATTKLNSQIKSRSSATINLDKDLTINVENELIDYSSLNTKASENKSDKRKTVRGLARHNSPLFTQSPLKENPEAVKSDNKTYSFERSPKREQFTDFSLNFSRNMKHAADSGILKNAQIPQLASPSKNVLASSLTSSSIKSLLHTKLLEPFGHSEHLSDSLKGIHQQKKSATPHYISSPGTLPEPRQLLAVKNNISTTQPERNLVSDKSILPSEYRKKPDCNLDHSIASSFAGSPQKSKVNADHVISGQSKSSSNPTQLPRTADSGHEAILIDTDILLPLRQRLGWSKPFQTATRLPDDLSNTCPEKNSESGSRTMRAEIVVQNVTDNKPMEEQNIEILDLDDSFCLEEAEVNEHLMDELSDKKDKIRTPQHQTSRKLKNTKGTWKEPSPFTPMAPYDDMNTPELKKAVSKIGVRPLGKKRMRELLKHVYHETHQYETDSDYDGTPVKYMRGSSQSSGLSARARISHMPIKSPRLDHIHKKLKPAIKKVSSNKQAEKKIASLINVGCAHPSLQKNNQPQSRGPETREKIIPESGLICGDRVSSSEGVDESTEEISGSQESSYSDGPDLPEESILQGWPEDDILPSQLIQSNSLAVTDKLVQFVRQNRDIHESILMYEPLELDILKKRLSDAGIKVSLPQVMDFLDERCITFTMKNMSSRNNNRQRRARPKNPGKSPSKSKTSSQRTATGSRQES